VAEGILRLAGTVETLPTSELEPYGSGVESIILLCCLRLRLRIQKATKANTTTTVAAITPPIIAFGGPVLALVEIDELNCTIIYGTIIRTYLTVAIVVGTSVVVIIV
jgi:hypothetical protein